VRKHTCAVAIDFVADGHIITQNRDVLHARPPSHGTVPADDGALDPSVLLDFAVLEQHGALQTHTLANLDVGSDNHIWPNLAVLADLRCRVDHDVTAKDVWLAGGCEKFAALLGEGREVETSARKEILRLTNVHPETFEVEAVKLTVLDDRGECLLLDRGGAQLNAIKDGRVEDVDTSVDAVTDEFDGLLYETVDARGVVRPVNNDSVLTRLFDLGDNNGTLLAVSLVVVGQLLEGVFANDIRVENEERRIIFAKDLLGELQRTSGTQWLSLDGELDVHVVLFLVFLKGLGHDLGAVVDSEDNVGDTSSGESLDLVDNHGTVAKLDEGFGEGEGERAQAGAEAADKNQSYIDVSWSAMMIRSTESCTLHGD
jgi:hypothetical protein